MAKPDTNPTPIRWRRDKEGKEVKPFLMKEASENKRSLNWWINEILLSHKNRREETVKK